MPDYLVTDPATGQRIKMTGPAPPSEALIRLALAKVQPLPSHAPQALQTPDPLQAMQKAQTIGPARVGERYQEDLNPSLVGIARKVLGGAQRPASVAAEDPYGIGAWLKGAGPMPTPIAAEIQAYHGSPHDFEKFLLEKIGTGEGAQAYGHGLYFAENPAVAEEYKRALGKVVPAFGDEPVKTSAESMAHDILSQLPRQAKDIRQNIYGDKKFYLVDKMSGEWGTHPFETAQEAQAATMTHNTVDAALRAVDQRAQQGVFKGKNEAQAIADVKQAIRDNFGKEAKTAIQGKTYHVSIKADPDQFLDWDKPLSQQSKAVQEAISKHPKVDPRYWFQEHFIDASGNVRGPVGDLKVTDEMRDALGKVGTTIQKPADLANGQTLYHHLREGGYPGDASEQLKDLGIPGIKYLDQGSRGQYSQATQGMISQFGSREKALDGLKARLKSNTDPERAGILVGMIDELRNPPTSNYVVFDDKLIDILKKYAVAGAVGGSLASLGQQQDETTK